MVAQKIRSPGVRASDASARIEGRTTSFVLMTAVLILDFGSQVTQLIARRVREAGVYCEIHPFNKSDDALANMHPGAIILSGGPASVTASDTPRAPGRVFTAGVPVLGIC